MKKTGKIKCWEIKKCPPNIYQACPAYLSNNFPCWEIKGLPLKTNKELTCVDCPVFIKHHNKEAISRPEFLRYHRQLIIADWGNKKQERLKKACVFIAGAGGLASSAAIYLASAGVGKIRICDCDNVEISNLNRQILHDDSKIGKNKAISAKETLKKINPHAEIIAIPEKITKNNVHKHVADAQIIVDCLDNFTGRFVLNKYAVKEKIPLVYGAIYGFDGQITFIHPPETGCLGCFYREGPPRETIPVIGIVPGIIGCLEAVEVIKFITKTGRNLKNKILVWNGLEQEFRKFSVKKDPDCKICGAAQNKNQ
jgi:adenylyltransferase/sulfurtransferase